MRIRLKTSVIIWHPDGLQVLLLRRSREKRFFADLFTGIGGAVELDRGEGDDLEGSLRRELCEETLMPPEVLVDLRLRLATMDIVGDEVNVLLWFTAQLTDASVDLSCSDGVLTFVAPDRLSDLEFIPTARDAVKFLLMLPADDFRFYVGCYEQPSYRLIVNRT